MNVITSTDGCFLMSCLSATFEGLEGLRYDVRVARWALDMARLEIPTVDAYNGPDAAKYRDSLQRRLKRLQTALDEKQAALDEAETREAVRSAQEAQTTALSPDQVKYMIKTLGKIEAWLDGLNLSKPDPYDFHARLLMRNEVTGVRDMMLNASVHSVSLISN
jgi:hypothetical protein